MRRSEELTGVFSPTDALDCTTSFHLVGIGGAGMSALARMLRHRGFLVSGTDSTDSPEVNRLQSEGIPVHVGHTGEFLQPDQALVLTDAIELARSPEYARAVELGLVIVRRSQALGWVLRDRKVIAVTGTHGKTTTTGLLGAALIEAGMDPLVVVGASIPDFHGPVREGAGEWAVVEACEAYDAFHDLQPEIVLLTNLELDHIDYHGTYEHLRDSVVRFAKSLPKSGTLVYCAADPGASEVAQLAEVPCSGYQIDHELPALTLGGIHNLLNASGARVAARLAAKGTSAPLDSIDLGLSHFGGAERRLQTLLEGPITIIDDYAHHPTEVAASLQAVRERMAGRQGRLIVAFQPHLYSRTAGLIPDFAAALDSADLIFLTDIYPAREAPMAGVSSARIAELCTKPVTYIPSRHLLAREVAAIAQTGDIIVGMGAGTITEFSHELAAELTATGPIRVAVVYGGDSSEREVSLHSGLAVYTALKAEGFEAELVDVSDILLKTGDLSRFVGPRRPDVAFLAVHGTNMEDGGMQGLFELLHIPYTGSGVQASSLAMDKSATKRILASEGIRTPKGVLVDSPTADVPFEGPWVVKPNSEGSTVGLSFVDNREDLKSAISRALSYDKSALVEELISGMEISTPVLIDRALLPVEIAPDSGRYDFASKYVPGATREIVPARLPDRVLERAQEIALKAHRVLGCRGATRTDAIVRGEEVIVLEVNTLPGLTGTSLLPNSAAASGIPFNKLCRVILEEALLRAPSRVRHG